MFTMILQQVRTGDYIALCTIEGDERLALVCDTRAFPFPELTSVPRLPEWTGQDLPDADAPVVARLVVSVMWVCG